MTDKQTEEITIQENKQLPDIEISEVTIKNLIYVIRGQQVMLDSDLAMLYQVETKVFNQAVKRNIERFPEKFRFQLTKEEYDSLRSQFVTSNGKGGRRYMPYVFTEQGIAMLSAVLRSKIAIQISIKIMDAFDICAVVKGNVHKLQMDLLLLADPLQYMEHVLPFVKSHFHGL